MVNKKPILQFIGRFLLYFIFIVGFIATSVLVNLFGPQENLYTDDAWEDADPYTPPGYNVSKHNVILDQHSHTLHSDGSLTVKQNVEWHISMGYNAIVITDHNTLSHKDDIDDIKGDYKKDGIIIILGMEWTTDRIHMNFIGIDEWDDPIPDNPTDKEIQKAIDEAHDQDAVVTCNHILWSTKQAGMDNHPSRDDLVDWGVDYIEIVNDDSLPEYVYDEKSDEYCDENPIGKITGTDMHQPDKLEGGGVRGWTLLNVTEMTEADIMDELRNKQTEIIVSDSPYLDQGDYDLNPSYVWVGFLAEFGEIIIDLYEEDGLEPIKVSIYLMYVFIPFALLEVYRVIKPRFWNSIDKLKDKRRKEKPTKD